MDSDPSVRRTCPVNFSEEPSITANPAIGVWQEPSILPEMPSLHLSAALSLVVNLLKNVGNLFIFFPPLNTNSSLCYRGNISSGSRTLSHIFQT